MKKELLLKTFGTGLFFFFVTSLFANVPVTPKRSIQKHRVENVSARPVCKSLQMAPLELKTLSRTCNLHKAAEETVVEYPDSTVIFTPEGKRTYITHFKYDDSNRMTHQTEWSITTENTWIKVKEQIVAYDRVGRPVYNEFYELQDNVWTGTQKGIVKYDEYGHQVYAESFYWNEASAEWINIQQEISEYRPDGLPIWEETYYWQIDHWDLMERDTYEYNAQSMVTKSMEYLPLQDGEGVYLSYYVDYEYDAVKTRLLMTRTEYESYDSEVQPVAIVKCTYTYNEYDEEILAFWENADEENEGEWIPDQKVIHEYTNGNQTLELVYDWREGEWRFNQRWEGEYDSKNRETKSRFFFLGIDGQPVISSQNTNEYDANDNHILRQVERALILGEELTVMQKMISAFDEASRQTLSENYDYDYTVNALIGVSKETSVYTGYKNNIAEYESYLWQNGGWFPYMKDVNRYENNILQEVLRSVGGANSNEWVESYKYTFEYNENNSLIRENLFKKTGANLWEMDVYLMYYYPSATGLKANRIIRPDISANNGVLTVSNLTGNEFIRIYNTNGQLIQCATSQGNSFFTSLPQGIYIICAGNVRSKIIME